MPGVVELQTRLDALRDLRANGIREARFGEDTVAYKSDAEMAAAIADLERQIAGASGRPLPRFINIRSTKGWL